MSRMNETRMGPAGVEIQLPYAGIGEEVWLPLKCVAYGSNEATSINKMVNMLRMQFPATRKIPERLLVAFVADLGYPEHDLAAALKSIKNHFESKNKVVNFCLDFATSGSVHYFDQLGDIKILSRFSKEYNNRRNEKFTVFQEALDDVDYDSMIRTNFNVISKVFDVDYVELPNVVAVTRVEPLLPKPNVYVNVNEALRIQQQYRDLQNKEVFEVDFYYDGKKVEVPQQELAEWDYTGLGLVNFIEMILKPKYIDKVEVKKE
jgi:hypothetical protein